MALWQFDIEVIPTERVQGRAQIDAAEFDNALWWSDRQPPTNFRERLASLLPAVKPWHEELLWYGDEQSDRIDVWMEQGHIESIGIRIDCRKPNVLFVRGLLNGTGLVVRSGREAISKSIAHDIGKLCGCGC